MLQQCPVLEDDRLRLVPAEEALAPRCVEFYIRNRDFLSPFEPKRPPAFFTLEGQQQVLRQEQQAAQEQKACRFYLERKSCPQELIGCIGLNEIVWGAFYNAFLGYKMDMRCQNNGYMTDAVHLVVQYAFKQLGLHRIEANIMPRNKASLRVVEKNGFVSEGLARRYLKINGVWEDHIHMVKLNEAE